MRRLEESQEPIAFKVDAVAPSDLAESRASGDDGGTVAFRVDIRSLAGMQKEALVSQIAPAGPTWRLASDEGPYLNGSDLAPFPLGFFAAGLQFTLLTELVRHAHREGIGIGALSAVQDTRYTMAGSAIRGDMTGGALPVDVQILMESAAPPDRVAALVARAVSTSQADAVMRDVLANAFALTLNGQTVPLAGLRESTRVGVADPAGAFDAVRPIWSVGIPRDLVMKMKEAEKVHGAEGGVASSLQAEQKRTLHIRADARLRDDGWLETVLTLFKPVGSTFRFLCDARAEAATDPRSPSGLAYLAAGIGFCYMTQLGRYAHIVKQQVHSTRMAQFNRFHRSRSGTYGRGLADPVDTHVFVDATEPAASIHRAVAMGEQTCFLHAAMRAHYQTTLRLALNGRDVAVPIASATSS